MIAVIPLMLLFRLIPACFIHGTDSGYCTNETLDYEFRIGESGQMTFCGKYIEYPACLPKPNTAIKRWATHTVQNKDYWVEQMAREHNRFRRSIELPAVEGDGNGVDEYGNTAIIQRFTKILNVSMHFMRCFVS